MIAKEMGYSGEELNRIYYIALLHDCGKIGIPDNILRKPGKLTDEKLYNAIAAWAEDDFRSVNGQIEYLLTECVKQRKKDGKYVSETLDEPPELDIK